MPHIFPQSVLTVETLPAKHCTLSFIPSAILWASYKGVQLSCKQAVPGFLHAYVVVAEVSHHTNLLRHSVYNEKRISVEAAEGEKTEYRVWNPFRSKLAASVLAGVDNIHIKPGGKVLYLGAASGTSVSHVSDIVGPTGAVFAVEFSHRSGESCHLELSSQSRHFSTARSLHGWLI